MFYVFCIFTSLFRRFRLSRVSQTIDLEEIYRLVSKILNFAPYGSVLSRFCVFLGGRAALSSGPVTCDTFGPDSSSSSLACGCKSCKMHTTILVKTPHHRACVGIMCGLVWARSPHHQNGSPVTHWPTGAPHHHGHVIFFAIYTPHMVAVIVVLVLNAVHM